MRDRGSPDRLDRRGFLRLGAALAAGPALLAACGGGAAPVAEPVPPEPAPDPPASTQSPPAVETGAAPPVETAPARPPIGEEPGDLRVFEWAGYEYPTFGGKGAKSVLGPYVDAYGKPEYEFLTGDDQAVGRARTGFRFDLVHPCVSYVHDWIEIDAVQPFDPALFTHFGELNPSMAAAGQVDGRQYFVPADWGFESVLYRADEVEVEEESWSLLFDERYAGKISWWESPVEMLVVWGYMSGVADPWDMSDEEIDEAKRFLIGKKKLVRNFWSSYTELNADIAQGNIWIALAWQDAWLAARASGIDVAFADPKEGRLSWLCGFMLGKDTRNYHHAHAYVDAWIGTRAAEWNILNYAYGHANTAVDLSKLSPELVEAFRLDDPHVLEEPATHIERFVRRRRAYAKAWGEVKAA